MLIAEVAAGRRARRGDPRLLPLGRRDPRPVRADEGVAARSRPRRAGAPRPRAGDGHGAAADRVPAPARSSRGSRRRPPHVALAACRSTQTAKEHRVGDVTRGAFSVALRRLARHAGHPDHVPLVARHGPRPGRPDGRGPATGAVPARARRAGRLRCSSTGRSSRCRRRSRSPTGSTGGRSTPGWSTDCGRRTGDEAFVLACTAPDGRPAGAVRVTGVQVGRSSVEPIGWTMEEVAYRAVVADVPLPPAEVQLDPWVAGPGGGDARADGRPTSPPSHDAVRAGHRDRGARRLAVAVRPGRRSGAPARRGAVRLRVAVPGPGRAQITRADGSADRRPGRRGRRRRRGPGPPGRRPPGARRPVGADPAAR